MGLCLTAAAGLGFLLLSGCASRVAIVGAHVVPMDAEVVLENHTVIIRGDRIEHVGPASSVRVPWRAKRVDARGKYLMPGLADLHIHLRSTDELLAYLHHGVTTVAHTGGAERGAPDLMRYRDDLEAGRMLGPSLYLSGPLIDGPKPIFPHLAVAVGDQSAARRVVSEQKRAGYDFIKTYYFLPRDAYLEVIRSAHAEGLPVIGHLPGEVDLFTALKARHDLFLHVSDFVYGTSMFDPKTRELTRDPAVIERVVGEAVASGTVVMPTLIASRAMIRKIDERDTVLADPAVGRLPPNVAAMWRSDTYTQPLTKKSYPISQEITRRLHQAGVPILTGTDSAGFGIFPGRGLHDELKELVAAGLSPYQALAASTVNAGRFITRHLPRAQPFGLVRPGHRADLILLSANPLADISNVSLIDAVMLGGEFVKRGLTPFNLFIRGKGSD